MTHADATSSHADSPLRRALSGSRALLWASALVLTGLIVAQLGRIAQSPAAPDAAFALPLPADVVTNVGDYTMMSFNAGSDDVLVVMDSRGEQLFAYRVANQRELQLLTRESLADVFAHARAMGSGRK